MPDNTKVYPQQGHGMALAKALHVRMTVVLADGRVVRWETGHPSEAAILNERPEPREISVGELPIVPDGIRASRVHLVISQGHPYTTQWSSPHQQSPVTWNPDVAFDQWAATGDPWDDDEVFDVADMRAAYISGIGAFLDSITDPADQGQFTITLLLAEGGHATQTSDQRSMAKTLIMAAQSPHLIQLGDALIITRAATPNTVSQGDRPSAVVDQILTDLGLDPADPDTQAIVTRRLNQAAEDTLAKLQ